MKFTKMHGIGNDYVYINCFEEKVENPSELAIKISDRHFGVGSDGLILIKPSDVADFKMDMYNADGSQAQMCGNGIRCVGKYVYDHGMTEKEEITIETKAGIKRLFLTIENNKAKMIKVDMGCPVLESELIPVISRNNPVINEPITVDDVNYHMTCVSMGNPHAVVFYENVWDMDIEKIGPGFENNSVFPEKTNTEFIEVTDNKTINMRVWERGSGETWACGTGACASVVATILNGKTDNEVLVHLKGGDLLIKWDRESNRVYMTGPAKEVFQGELS